MDQQTTEVYYHAVILENMKNREDIIRSLSAYLLEKGYVTEQYQSATLEREELYPTGLATKPIGVAVPHSQAENVKRPAIIMGISKNQVAFHEMGNADSEIDVGVVFLLALKKENAHLNYLRNIVNFCKIEENIIRLYQSKSEQEAYNVLATEILCE
ncbi:PTS system, galactitol-specific IIA component [Propionispira arboris]|uniref:PTS system, galactitol-specific IIA component n=1 Tax=Propionispira arboris TaxID=84035 RepID=A0A1H6ZDN6_9FIRM|nr:PTS sugar transporter subunit IIA [Propionispira arboris]SEJ47772.1 PTS system, galactitol-specific IIA component [Propionispira arboris]